MYENSFLYLQSVRARARRQITPDAQAVTDYTEYKSSRKRRGGGSQSTGAML